MNVHFSSKTPEWETPTDFFDKLNEEFLFTLDPAATKENAKLPRFFTMEQDGLSQSWIDERVFVNPPYGRVIGAWVEKMATGGLQSWLPYYQLVPILGGSISTYSEKPKCGFSRDVSSSVDAKTVRRFQVWSVSGIKSRYEHQRISRRLPQERAEVPRT